MLSFILLFIGLLLIFLEFYTPGGILAVAGTIVILFAVTSFLVESSAGFASLFFILFTIAATAFVIWFALNRIKKTSAKNTFYLSDDQEGYQGAHFDTSLIGKQGLTLTDLGPSGFVLIEGKRHQAGSRGPYVDKGTDVLVIGGEGSYLIVKPVQN